MASQSNVVAVFRNRSDAESAANDLKANGFGSGDVYVGSYNDTGSSSTTREWNETHQHEGGIKGWFKSLFGEDDSADYRDYEDAANKGGVIVSVAAADQDVDRVTQILENHNPLDINENVVTAQATGAKTRQTAPVNTGQRAGTTAGSTSRKKASNDLPASIPVVEEELQVGKRQVLRGGVRVYSRVTEKPVEETVNLREEKVRVERQPVNRPVQAGDLRAGTEQVIEVEEYAEEPVIQKQARVVEEVRVSKDVSERQENVRDTVRRQDVEVQNLNRGDRGERGQTAYAAADQGNYREDFRRDFQTRYAASGNSWEDYEPAYAYGYNAASDPRYQGRNWDDVESDLRSGYNQRYSNSTWEKMKDSIRYGWDKVTGRTRSATTHGD